MHNFIKASLREIGRHLLVLVALGGMATVAFAFTEPSGGPPNGGTVYAPVNTGGTAQNKSGTLTIGPTGSIVLNASTNGITTTGAVTGNIINANPALCLSGASCITSWSQAVSLGGGGGGTPGGSNGQVQFNNGAGGFGGDTNLFWDNANKRLGIGTPSPQSKLDVNGGLAIGSYAGASVAPSNGMIISGNVGIGTASPDPTEILTIVGAPSAVGGLEHGPRVSIRTTGSTTIGPHFRLMEDLNNGGSISGGSNWIVRVGGNAPGEGTPLGTFAIVEDAGTQNRLVIAPGTGNVGIGTVTPTHPLAVSGSIGLPLLLQDTTTNGSGVEMQEGGGGDWLVKAMGSNGGFKIRDITANGGAGADRLLITNTGNIGIGTASPGYTLTVNGTAWVSSGTWSGSDIRWKKNITPLEDSLSKLLQLQGVTFNWRKEEYPDLKFSDGPQIGFIAQDVEKVFPEVVTTDTNGYKGISYEKLVPVLTESIKSQQKEIESLKARLDALEKKWTAPPNP